MRTDIPPARLAIPRDITPLLEATELLLGRSPIDFTVRPLLARLREDPIAAARFAERCLVVMSALFKGSHPLARACALVSAAGRWHVAVRDGYGDHVQAILVANWRAAIAAFEPVVEHRQAASIPSGPREVSRALAVDASA